MSNKYYEDAEEDVVYDTEIIDVPYREVEDEEMTPEVLPPKRLTFGRAMRELETEQYYAGLTRSIMDYTANLSMMEETFSRAFASSPHARARFQAIVDSHVNGVLARMKER